MKWLIKLLGGYSREEYKKVLDNWGISQKGWDDNRGYKQYKIKYDKLVNTYKKITSKYNTKQSRLYRGRRQIIDLIENTTDVITKKKYLKQLNDIKDRLEGDTKRGRKTK